MKKTVAFFFFLALCLNVLADSVSVERAQDLGVKFMKTTARGQRGELQADLTYTYGFDGEAELYVFNIHGGGFVIVSAEDRVKPVLGYATEGCFSPDDLADGFAFRMAGYQEEIRYVRQHNITATPDIIAEWQSVEATGFLKEERRQNTVKPLLETVWSQDYPYNSQCPEDPQGSGGHAAVGCVAVALGQILKCWNYPIIGAGSMSYVPSNPSYPTQTANFGRTYYHTEWMPNKLDEYSTEEEIFYVAQLLHHLGVAFGMEYGPHASSASPLSVTNVLPKFFGFTNGIFITLSSYGMNGYVTALKTELGWGRPVFYYGFSSTASTGHAYVCDGYDENDMFHFNWGWNGSDDGYFAIGALNTTNYDFNYSNQALIGFYPGSVHYFSRPEAISDLTLTETAHHDAVILNWINPSVTIADNALMLDTLFVCRNYSVVGVLSEPQLGASMSFVDTVPEPGHYEYSVYASNSSGCGVPVYQSITVGEKCDLTFHLHDAGGDGWGGATITITDTNNRRLAELTMRDGADTTFVLPLLRRDLYFIWRHGWHHNNPLHDTDSECSFSILDGDGDAVFVSPESLPDGIFLRYDNQCGYDLPENAASSVRVYPNPVGGMLTVEGEGLKAVRILNLQGQKLCETLVDGSRVQLDMSRYAAGMYLVGMETGSGMVVRKVSVLK